MARYIATTKFETLMLPVRWTEFSYKRAYNKYWVVDAEPNGAMPPPGRGNGSDPELLDSPIGLFHYPSPGALLRCPEVLFSNKKY